MRKAQMEIMGLAIIVVLITLGLLFFLRFKSTSRVDDVRQDFMDTKLASNLLNVILKTTHRDRNEELDDIYQRCAEGVTDPNFPPCEKVNETVKLIFEQTLERWKVSYHFVANLTSPAEVGKQIKTEIRNGSCGIGYRGYTRMESETYPLPTRKGTMLLTLEICR